MQAILGFLKYQRAFAFEDVLSNFLTTMGWQTVHHHGMTRRFGQ